MKKQEQVIKRKDLGLSTGKSMEVPSQIKRGRRLQRREKKKTKVYCSKLIFSILEFLYSVFVAKYWRTNHLHHMRSRVCFIVFHDDVIFINN